MMMLQIVTHSKKLANGLSMKTIYSITMFPSTAKRAGKKLQSMFLEELRSNAFTDGPKSLNQASLREHGPLKRMRFCRIGSRKMDLQNGLNVQ